MFELLQNNTARRERGRERGGELWVVLEHFPKPSKSQKKQQGEGIFGEGDFFSPGACQTLRRCGDDGELVHKS